MNKTQRDLLAACWNKRMAPDYNEIREYAYRYNKYNYLSMRDIDEVVRKLESLYQTS